MPDILQNLSHTALAFRGYNITNLGRTPELLEHPVYGPHVAAKLRWAGELCGHVVGRRVDLVSRVRERREATLTEYPEAISLVFAINLAHIELLEQFHGFDKHRVRLSYGYSLGELSAMVCSGICDADSVLRIPLALAADSVALAHDVTMGILFSRGPVIEEGIVRQLCQQISSEGHGTLGISTILSPNGYLLLGQGKTLDRFREIMEHALPERSYLRLNSDRWPPLHTPIVRQRYIPDRASVLMEKIHVQLQAPSPPVLSLVTGKYSYNNLSVRDVLRDWVDHPQRLWDGVCVTLQEEVDTLIHVGPEPNLIPATFCRLRDNVQQQLSKRTLSGYGLRAVSSLARRPWLASLLPQKTALLRAPRVQHVVLEEWLLSHPPK